MKKTFASVLTTLTVVCSLLGFAACGGNAGGRKVNPADPIVGSWYNEQITDESITQTLYQIEYLEGASRYAITVCTLKYDRKADSDYDTPTRSFVTERKASVFVRKNDYQDFNLGKNEWVEIPDGQYEYRGPIFAPDDRDFTWFFILSDDAATFNVHIGESDRNVANGNSGYYGIGATASQTPSGYTFKKIRVSLENFKNQTQRRDAGGNKMWERDQETGMYADEHGVPLPDQQDTSKRLPIWSWQNYTGRN